MTAAMALGGREGRARVAGVDLLLTDISAFTVGLRAGAHGQVTVLTGEGRVIGLPPRAGDRAAAAQREALLKRPEEIDAPMLAWVTRALASRDLRAARPAPAAARRRALVGGAPALSCSAPTASSVSRSWCRSPICLGGLTYLRLGIALVMVAALALAVLYSLRLARRLSRPIAALVAESERISRGDLDGGPPVTSRFREVHRLTDAHGRMRGSLKTLLRIERDLQVARRIQQDTLPERIPAVPGFDIHGWNEPAEETGGDTYDVIGCRHVPGEDGSRLVATEAERAVLLLADASGHGIGPALSVTQVRAMLRMASPRRRGPARDRPPSERAALRRPHRGPLRHRLGGRARRAGANAPELQLRAGAAALLPHGRAGVRDDRDRHRAPRLPRRPRGRPAGADPDGAGRCLRGAVGRRDRRGERHGRALRDAAGDRSHRERPRGLGRGAGGGPPAGADDLHRRGPARRRPDRRRHQVPARPTSPAAAGSGP